MKRYAVVAVLLVGLACVVDSAIATCANALECVAAVQHDPVMALSIDALLAAGVGLIIVTMRMGSSFLGVQRKMAALPIVGAPAQLHAAAQRHGIPVPRCIASPASSAFCVGSLAPRVYVTSGLIDRLSRSELEAVLLHETEHARRRDPMRLALRAAIDTTCLHVPLVARWRMQQVRHAELRADAAAVATVGPEALVGALLATGADALTDERIGRLSGDGQQHQPFRLRDHVLSAGMLVGTALMLLCVAEATILIGNGGIRH